MTKKERSIWDDINELGREIAEKIDEMLNPHKRRQAVPVPIPIRPNHPQENPNQD